MAISKDLFLSILAMDAYNRGYGAGISDSGQKDDPDGLGYDSGLGQAAVLDPLDLGVSESDYTAWRAAGFYALAYEVNGVAGIADGTRVISYRGTDEVKDVWNGWTSIGGIVPAQAELAAQFYHSVRAANPDGKIMLTGHSLGGALAGFVASLFGEEAVLYDNIPFEVASYSVYNSASITDDEIEQFRLIGDESTASLMEEIRQAAIETYYHGGTVPTLDREKITTLYLPGEVAGSTRLGQLTATVAVGSQGSEENLDAVPDLEIALLPPSLKEAAEAIVRFLPTGSASSAINLHWQSTLAIKLYSQQFGHDPFVSSIYSEFFRSLYSNEIAAAAEIMTANAGDFGIMQKLIAYSALEPDANGQGTLIFGDTGIRAMFDDLDALGGVYAEALDGQRLELFDSDLKAEAADTAR